MIQLEWNDLVGMKWSSWNEMIQLEWNDLAGMKWSSWNEMIWLEWNDLVGMKWSSWNEMIQLEWNDPAGTKWSSWKEMKQMEWIDPAGTKWSRWNEIIQANTHENGNDPRKRLRPPTMKMAVRGIRLCYVIKKEFKTRTAKTSLSLIQATRRPVDMRYAVRMRLKKFCVFMYLSQLPATL